MSYDYMLFRGAGPAPDSMEQIDPSALRPFASFDEAKALLSGHCPGLAWDDRHQIGKIDNDIGYFEFQCFEPLIATGTLGLRTSFRQSVEDSHRFITLLCRAAGFYAIDQQTLRILA